jgi:hypothetical protein
MFIVKNFIYPIYYKPYVGSYVSEKTNNPKKHTFGTKSYKKIYKEECSYNE